MSQTSEQVRVGFIGAGAICEQRHLPNLATRNDTEIVAVCNRTAESGKRIADKWNISDVLADWKELVARPDIDAVFIGTWPYTHAEMAVAALQAKKHVFCQARMAANLEQARAMLDAADNNPELVDMICPPPHRMPFEPYIKHVLQTKQLGDIWEVRVVCRNASDVGPLNWRQRIEYSGQQIMQIGIWAEVLHALVGEYRELSVKFAIPISEKPDPQSPGNTYRIDIPQVVSIAGVLKSGVVITEDHSAVAAGENQNHITITGSDGALRFNAYGDLQIAKPASDTFFTVDVPDQYVRDWQAEDDFINAIHLSREGVPSIDWGISPDFSEGMKYMKKMDAIHRAARHGKVVMV